MSGPDQTFDIESTGEKLTIEQRRMMAIRILRDRIKRLQDELMNLMAEDNIHYTNKTDYKAAHMPTEEEIAERAAEIKAKNLAAKFRSTSTTFEPTSGIRVCRDNCERRPLKGD